MKKQILSAELERYNANSRGNRSGDCVKRAISLAFDLSYNDISKLLINKMHEKHRSKWNVWSVYNPVILELGGIRHNEPDPAITVDEFADTIGTSGSYIIQCGATPDSVSHLVCIRDGKVWDSWDSRNYYVSDEYYSVPAGVNKSINDSIDKYYMNDIANNYAQPAVNNELLRYMNSKKWSYKYYATDYAVSKYQIVVRAQFALESNDVVPKDRKYEFKVPFVIEPTWTEPEILEYVNKNGKQKTYDRLWAINEQEKKLVDEYQMRSQMQDQEDEQWKMFMTPAERKFYNSLPGWFRPLVTWLDIQSPGQYMGSYTVRFKKHPQDHDHPDKNKYTFEGWNADDIRNMINEYKNGYRVEGIDYYYADEY